MKTSVSKSAIHFIAVALLFFSFAGYNFIRAYDESVWFPPDGLPASRNVAAPINTGTISQIKSGDLTVNNLSSIGSVAITSVSPKIWFNETDARGWWMTSSNNSLNFQSDRNMDGSSLNEQPWPLKLVAGATSTDDYALFSNEVRSEGYCDRSGENCFTPSTVSALSSNFITTYSLTANLQSISHSGKPVCSCKAGDYIAGCSGPQHDEYDNSVIIGENACYGESSQPICTCIHNSVTKLCQVTIATQILDYSGNVLENSSRTVEMQGGTLPRFGMWADGNNVVQTPYFTQLVYRRGGPHINEVGWWTEQQYLTHQDQISAITYKWVKSLTLVPGNVQYIHGGNGFARIDANITATVLSCS